MASSKAERVLPAQALPRMRAADCTPTAWDTAQAKAKPKQAPGYTLLDLFSLDEEEGSDAA